MSKKVTLSFFLVYILGTSIGIAIGYLFWGLS